MLFFIEQYQYHRITSYVIVFDVAGDQLYHPGDMIRMHKPCAATTQTRWPTKYEANFERA
jgi:hypothetical protein